MAKLGMVGYIYCGVHYLVMTLNRCYYCAGFLPYFYNALVLAVT